MDDRRKTMLATAALLGIDRATAEVVTALREDGIDALVLKGPTLAAWLYDDGVTRVYRDSDVLVDPSRFADAERVLRRLGFELRELSEIEHAPHAHTWGRTADGSTVDLHHAILGATVPAHRQWALLWASRTSMRVGGLDVPVLDLHARALHVVLHAHQHGTVESKPLEDLRRAIERTPAYEWSKSLELARGLGIEPGFVAGLRLLPEGAAIAEGLGLTTVASVDARLRAGGASGPAVRIERLLSTKGVAAKLALLLRELFPTTAFIRGEYRLASRGPAGLVLAYLWRPFSLVYRTVPAYFEWRRARRGR